MRKADSMIILYVSLILMVVFSLTYAMNGVAMSMFSGKAEEVILFSPIEGVLTFEGKPTSGAKILRKINWKDEVGETDIFYANEKGEFTLPIKKESIKISSITQFVVHQKIDVFYAGKNFVIWTIGKDSKSEFGELNGKPKNFRCELTDDDVPYRLENALLLTSCKWS